MSLFWVVRPGQCENKSKFFLSILLTFEADFFMLFWTKKGKKEIDFLYNVASALKIDWHKKEKNINSDFKVYFVWSK